MWERAGYSLPGSSLDHACLRGRAEMAPDVDVLDEHPRLASRRARNAFDLHHLDLAAALRLRGNGVRDAAALVAGERRIGDHLQHELARVLLLVLDGLDRGELGKVRHAD